MTPYYQDDAVTIYHADCRDVLASMPADNVAIVCTSPPYNTLPTTPVASGMHTGNRFVATAAHGYFDQRDEGDYQLWLRDIIADCLRVARGLVWVNHKIRYRDGVGIHPLRFLPFPVYSEIVWDRCVAMALNCRRFAPSHEGLWAFGAPHYWCRDNDAVGSVWRFPPDRTQTEHPCSFPRRLVDPLIVASSRPGEVVLDPFAGSGTTGRAAKDLGRKAVLVELEEQYCEMAANRMRQEVLSFTTEVT